MDGLELLVAGYVLIASATYKADRYYWRTKYPGFADRNGTALSVLGAVLPILWPFQLLPAIRLYLGKDPDHQRYQRERQEHAEFMPPMPFPYPAFETVEQAAERLEARRRARTLLLDGLSPEQRTEYEQFNAFTVRCGPRTYRISQGKSHNVALVEDGRVTRTFCAYPTENVPDEDAMLAQKIALETDEAGFLVVANHNQVAYEGLNGYALGAYGQALLNQYAQAAAPIYPGAIVNLPPVGQLGQEGIR